MQDFITSLCRILTAISVAFSVLISPAVIQPQTANPIKSYLEYPEEAVVSLESVGLDAKTMIDRISAELPEYVQSGGYDDVAGVFVSPYYTAKVRNMDIPVYASMVFNRADDTGDIHSFSEVYVDTDSEFSFNIELRSDTVELRNAIVLPEVHGVGAECRNGVIRASITKPGIYTFLVNGAQQHYGYTLFVREAVDEDAEIAEYIETYGEKNVTVLDKGVYEYDYVNFYSLNNQVIYLRQGAYVMANHLYDIDCAEDENKYFEPDAPHHNSIGLTRYPFLNFNNCNNITLAGRGVIDLTRLDRRERRGVVFTNCDDVNVRGIKIINSPEWSFISYCCTNLNIDQVDIIGSRGNCDGFAICNTHNAVIENCFARVADDTFEVKALGGRMGSDNITFQNCIAWGGYARCFGITGEVNRSITNVTFRDSAVVYRDGVWDNNRIGSLVVVAEQCDGSIDGVLFENIEIFRDEGRPILVKIYDEEKENFEVKNIVYKDIRYTSYMPAKIDGTDSDTNTLDVKLENITAAGYDVTKDGIFLEVGRNCNVNFGK
ncbi:MAG: hypothetical protein IJF20_00330 [Clostridia bacterium]|nr:hypothetical protein [Clostridia bacterium]